MEFRLLRPARNCITAVPNGEFMKTTSKLVFASMLVLLWANLSFGQGSATGDLHVTVKDEKGNLITNATVTAREQNKGFERATTLNNEGEYRLLSLPPGMYTVSVSAPGFGKYETHDQQVTVGQMRELPVALQIGSVQTVVSVTSQAEL